MLLQRKNLWHLGAVALFLLVSISYFHPTLSGHTIKQPDVQKWAGAAQEIIDYRNTQGQEVHWTNALFSGMPSVQIATVYSGLIIVDTLRDVLTLWLPSPINFLFLYFIGFYLLGLSFKIKPHLALLGAIAFGLSSYFIIILEAGHNTKASAIGYAPLVLAGFIWAYQSKRWLLSSGLAGLFMAFELRANHLQVTYYLIFLLVAIGIIELIKALKNQDLGNFIKRTVALIVVYVVAAILNFGNILGTLDYTKHTTRGGTELTINADGSKKETLADKNGGLDIDYITNWSYGIGESFTFIVPNFKGGATQYIKDDKSNKGILADVDRSHKQNVSNYVQYWGDQPFTSGPVYIGVIIVFLSVLAFYYVEDKIKWAMLAITALALALSWGKNFLGLTEFFVNYFPGYNKFRTVTIILYLVELILPLMAILFLSKLIQNRDKILENIKPFYIISGLFGLLLIAFTISPEAFNTFLTEGDLTQLDQLLEKSAEQREKDYYNTLFDEISNTRIVIFKKDVLRTLAFFVIGFGTVFAFLKGWINKYLLSGLLTVFILADLIMVDSRYLNMDTKGNQANWIESWKQTYPFSAGNGDKTILAQEMQSHPEVGEAINSEVSKVKQELKANKTRGGEAKQVIEHAQFRTLNRLTNFRVFEQGNPFNSTRSSYFHKSIGGYHGAKLGIYQELIEFHIGRGNQAVINMLNTKYNLSPNGDQAIPNQNALGNAWFVKSIKPVADADEAILSLNVINSYQVSSYNGYTVSNGNNTGQAITVDGQSPVSLIQPDGASSQLPEIPYSASTQQPIVLVNTPNGPQWSYINPQLADSLTLVKVTNQQSGFNPKDEAIVIGAEAQNYSGQGSIILDSYNPDQLLYSSSSSEEQFAVFSEVFYKDGWTAYIDNEKIDEIERVNYVLRGLKIPAGDHKIEFRYESATYQTSNTLSLLFSCALILFIGFAVYLEVIKPGKTDNSNT